MTGTALPKTIIRPFLCPDGFCLNDKQYKLVAANDKLSFVETFSTVMLIFSGIFGLIILLSFIYDKVESWEELGVIRVLFLATLLPAIILSILRFIYKPTKFEIFDRQNGTITFTRPFTRRVWICAPWVEWQGWIYRGASSVGVANYHLMLMHVPTKKSWEVFSSVTGEEILLSYWSFLVQYMDNTKPLPNVCGLEKYGEVTNGLEIQSVDENT